ncbi:hypothetical protein Ddc_12466 [Ditylenchus destructor]|nr:hypothetical protein Ddc_12466 [Ditylenchus destructor]
MFEYVLVPPPNLSNKQKAMFATNKLDFKWTKGDHVLDNVEDIVNHGKNKKPHKDYGDFANHDTAFYREIRKVYAALDQPIKDKMGLNGFPKLETFGGHHQTPKCKCGKAKTKCKALELRRYGTTLRARNTNGPFLDRDGRTQSKLAMEAQRQAQQERPLSP